MQLQPKSVTHMYVEFPNAAHVINHRKQHSRRTRALSLYKVHSRSLKTKNYLDVGIDATLLPRYHSQLVFHCTHLMVAIAMQSLSE